MPAALDSNRSAVRTNVARRTRQPIQMASTAISVAKALSAAPRSSARRSRDSLVASMALRSACRVDSVIVSSVCAPGVSTSPGVRISANSPSIETIFPWGTFSTLTSPAPPLSSISAMARSKRLARSAGVTPRNESRSTATLRFSTLTSAASAEATAGDAVGTPACAATISMTRTRPCNDRHPKEKFMALRTAMRFIVQSFISRAPARPCSTRHWRRSTAGTRSCRPGSS